VPIFLEELVDETASFIISTFVLVIVGEITPQAICSRYALAIGASVIWIMRIFTVLLYVIAKPIAMILDRILGEEMGTIYNKNEVRELSIVEFRPLFCPLIFPLSLLTLQLIEIVKHHKDQGALDMDEAAFVKGALEYTSKSVWEVFTPVNQVYMLSADDVLDYNLISDIFKQGHSRIPVKAANTDSESGKEMKIVGILLVKVQIYFPTLLVRTALLSHHLSCRPGSHIARSGELCSSPRCPQIFQSTRHYCGHGRFVSGGLSSTNAHRVTTSTSCMPPREFSVRNMTMTICTRSRRSWTSSRKINFTWLW